MNAVHDTMSASPVAVEPTTSIGKLLALFDRYDFNAFPVAGQHDNLLGIISKLDVVELFLGHRGSTPSAADAIATTYVADVMHRKPVFVESCDAITAAGNLMAVMRLRSLPVVGCQEGRLDVGFPSSRCEQSVRWSRTEQEYCSVHNI
jgi:CBS domain-containing protein